MCVTLRSCAGTDDQPIMAISLKDVYPKSYRVADLLCVADKMLLSWCGTTLTTSQLYSTWLPPPMLWIGGLSGMCYAWVSGLGDVGLGYAGTGLAWAMFGLPELWLCLLEP